MSSRPNPRDFLCVGLVFLLLVLTGSPSAGAATSSAQNPSNPDEIEAFDFYPADSGYGTYFQPFIEAGGTTRLIALIANTGTTSIELRTYANNAHTALGGGFGAAEYGEPANDVTSWLDYPERTFIIESGTGVEITYSVSVPEGTKPGQYITAIAAEDAEPQPFDTEGGITQRLRYLIPVFITVPGEMTAGFEVGQTRLEIVEDVLVIRVELINTGDVRVRPEGSVELLDAAGDLVATFPVKMASIYARDRTTLTLGLAGGIATGHYDVRVKLRDPDTGEEAFAFEPGLPAELAQPAVPPTFSIADGSAMPGPAADNVQFVSIAATIRNIGEPATGVQLSLLAKRDGEEVERYPINQSLALPTGETAISARYIPATGWTSGEWSFELLLETVEPSGAAVVVTRLTLAETVSIQ